MRRETDPESVAIAGARAFDRGLRISNCPYGYRDHRMSAWIRGWMDRSHDPWRTTLPMHASSRPPIGAIAEGIDNELFGEA